MLDPAEEERASIVAELRRLRTKLTEVSDKDIKLALGQRIEALDLRLAELKASPPAGGDAPTEPNSETIRSELETELKRLKVKHDAVGDADLRMALSVRIDDLKARLATLSEDEAVAPAVELPPPPSDTERESADKLVQQARVEKMRGNAVGVANLLREASRIAPGSVEVLELLGDELASQGKHDDAIATYDRARKLDPKNVNVDRKHAELVFRSRAAGASALMAMADQQALASGASAANWFALFLPGVGHMVLGIYAKGAIIFGTWAIALIWLFVAHKDLQGLLHQVGVTIGLKPQGGAGDYSLTIVIPILAGAIAHATSILTCKGDAREAAFLAGSGKVSHPKPPVDLPFD